MLRDKGESTTSGDDNESAVKNRRVAAVCILARLFAGLNEMNLTTAYYNQMRPSIEDHMRKAGVHLARILEAVFGNQIIGIEA